MAPPVPRPCETQQHAPPPQLSCLRRLQDAHAGRMAKQILNHSQRVRPAARELTTWVPGSDFHK
jgi:hypothetical protein